MSLNMGTIYEKQNMIYEYTPIKKECIKIKGNYFFFIYNTDNYFHFLYDSLNNGLVLIRSKLNSIFISISFDF